MRKRHHRRLIALMVSVLVLASLTNASAVGTRIVLVNTVTGGATGDISVTASCASNESVTGGGFASLAGPRRDYREQTRWGCDARMDGHVPCHRRRESFIVGLCHVRHKLDDRPLRKGVEDG